MIREFHLADFLTLANAACGIAAVFFSMLYMGSQSRAYFFAATALTPAALVFDWLDGRVARWRHEHSVLGRELDSLADIIAFGVAPAALGFAAGMRGGWDWFAIELSDRRSIMLSLVRGAEGDPLLVYGTVLAGSRSINLSSRDVRVQVTRRWRSARTGADYPAGWRVTIPRIGLAFDLKPTVADQELDTRASSGATYWEGSQTVVVHAIGSDGKPRGGKAPTAQAYVELTGYAPQSTAGVTASPRP